MNKIEKLAPWIDAHVHLQSREWFKGAIFERKAKTNRRRQAPRKPLSDTEYRIAALRQQRGEGRGEYGPGIMEQGRRFVDQMDEAGIDTAVLYAMDFDYTGEKLRVDHWHQLVQLKGVVDAYPGRFLLCAAIDPRRGKEGIALLRRSVEELGVIGMGEFAPHFFGFAPNDREHCYPIYETCSELGIPIGPNCSIIGSSHNSRFCHPLYFEDVANDFPNLNIALTSGGAPHWTEEAICLCGAKHNMFMDIGDWQSDMFVDPTANVLAVVRRMLDTPARHKIMFGSDFPVYASDWSERAWVEVFTTKGAEYGISFTEEELNLFFSDNAQEFLDMDIVFPV
ncbi:MAG: amidohydrolase family protein [Pseudomonadota bacterium]